MKPSLASSARYGASEPPKVVIDTNVWLARTEDLRYGRLCAFCKRQAIVAGRPRREAFPDVSETG